MELSETLRRRRMVRRYDPERAVPLDLVTRVVDAAVRAPSAGFTQAVSYQILAGAHVAAYWTVTTDRSAPDRWLAGVRTAPVLILVWTSEMAYLDRYAEPDKGWTDRDPARWSAPYWWVDAGMGVMAALLTAVDAGLGACFFGIPVRQQDQVRSRFAVPADQQSVGVLSLGYAAEAAVPPRARRARDEVIHHGRWNSAGA